MDLDEKNKRIEEAIQIIADEVNKEYKGLIDKDKIRELYEQYKDSDKSLDEDILPEIKGSIEKVVSDYLDLKKDLEDMMNLKMKQESDKLATLGDSSAVGLNEQRINYLVIEQLESKEDVKKYISDVCSQFPSIDSLAMMDTFDEIISDEQIEEVRNTLSQTYKAELNSKYGSIEVGSPEEARAKLAALGVDTNDIEIFVEKVANGERIEAIAQLADRYGEQIIEGLEEPAKVDEIEMSETEVEDATLDNTNGQIYIKKKDHVRRLVNPNGYGFTIMLVALVSFGIGVISIMTYLVISSIFR